MIIKDSALTPVFSMCASEAEGLLKLPRPPRGDDAVHA